MAGRMMIVKVKRTDQGRAELYGQGHKFPALRLFDLGLLTVVGIDPETLPIGEERAVSFWAVYESSDKLTSAGNPYKDVVSLERIDGTAATPPVTTDSEPGEILAEVRAIRGLLQDLAGAGCAEGVDLDLAFPRYGDGSALGDNPAEVTAYQEHVEATGHAPANLEALRAWVEATRAGK